MEAKPLENCGRPETGGFIYQDHYGIIYEFSWFTAPNGDFDITVVTKDPQVWGEPPQARRVNNVLFRRGIITTERMILRTTSDGYIIVSSGIDQTVEFFQATFPCGPRLTDPFCYHLDSDVVDDIEYAITCGPRFADPAVANDDNVVFGEIDGDGNVYATDEQQLFQFVDVWSNVEDLTGTCG